MATFIGIRGQLASEIVAGMDRNRWPLCVEIRMFSRETVRDFEAKLTPALAEELRHRRRRRIGRSWYVDETFIKVHGRWRYLYRAIDRDGEGNR